MILDLIHQTNQRIPKALLRGELGNSKGEHSQFQRHLSAKETKYSDLDIERCKDITNDCNHWKQERLKWIEKKPTITTEEKPVQQKDSNKAIVVEHDPSAVTASETDTPLCISPATDAGLP